MERCEQCHEITSLREKVKSLQKIRDEHDIEAKKWKQNRTLGEMTHEVEAAKVRKEIEKLAQAFEKKYPENCRHENES